MPKTIKIKYLKAYDYRSSLATGVYGNVTTNGLINVNFFSDRVVLPDHQLIPIDDQGRQIGKPEDVKDGDAVRDVHFGVLMDIDTAKLVIQWLETKIKEHEKAYQTLTKANQNPEKL